MYAYIALTDTHLSSSTIEQNISIFDQLIDLCISKKCYKVVHYGDIFDSRRAQSLDVLLCFDKILQKLDQNGILMYAIPGNHDKVDPSSEDSYLDIFNRDNFKVIRSTCKIDFTKFTLHLIPYFSERTTYSKYLDKVALTPGKINILATHIAIDGVRNNDGSVVKNSISKGAFDKFNCVHVGHYHDRQEFENIFYVGSTDTRNFGENDEKGFILVDNNACFEYIQSQFVIHRTKTFQADQLDQEFIQHLIDTKIQDGSVDQQVRIVIKGTKSEIAKIDLSQLSKVAEIKYDYQDLIVTTQQTGEIVTKSILIEYWTEFAKLYGFSENLGVKYIQKYIQK